MGVKLVSASGGSVELVAPATATNYTATMPAATGTVLIPGNASAITSGTAQASTSGTSINFTDIPSWVKRITVMFNGVSTTGTSGVQVQLGTSAGFVTTGYLSTAQWGSGSNLASTTGLVVAGVLAADTRYGALMIAPVNSTDYVSYGNVRSSTTAVQSCGGGVTISGPLTQIRITTVNGTDTFDAGSINIIYE